MLNKHLSVLFSQLPIGKSRLNQYSKHRRYGPAGDAAEYIHILVQKTDAMA